MAWPTPTDFPGKSAVCRCRRAIGGDAVSDGYYRSAAWKRLRALAIERDGGMCVVPGCGERMRTVDHIVARKDGGADALPNLRCLCALHDNQAHREKRGGGKRDARFTVPGCDTTGQPRDPRHWWNAE